jgi:hypothetical protein
MLETNWPQVNIRYHDYFSGPFVEIKTTEIEKWGEFLIRFYEIIGDKKELVDQKAIWGNNWYETPRKFYTNWYTEVLGFQNNKIVKVGWDRFDLYGKKVAIWLQNGYNNILDVNFHLETLPVIEEFANKHKCYVTVVSDFAPSLSSSNKHISFMSMLTADEARSSYYATYRIGIYAGEENYIRLPWDDLKSQPVLNSNRLHYDQFHPRNVIKLNLSPSEIARDILFGFDHNDLSYNNYYQSTKSILSSKQVWLP